MSGRYAVYYLPGQDTLLYRLGSSFLGRCAYLGEDRPRPELPEIPEETMVRHTRRAALYGLHGTVVAPFETADEEKDLAAAVERIARDTRPFALRRPRLTAINGLFAAVAPDEGTPEELSLLERRCLEDLSPFRLPLNARDIARRGPLPPRHLANLRRWGYHLVFDDFNFHITLADSLPEEPQRFLAALEEYLEPALAEPLIFDRLGLLHQPSRAEPFVCRRIFSLRGFDNEH